MFDKVVAVSLESLVLDTLKLVDKPHNKECWYVWNKIIIIVSLTDNYYPGGHCVFLFRLVDCGFGWFPYLPDGI